MRYNGLKIIVSQNAMQLLYNWPDKPRSKRMIKKMTKRLGPQIYFKPTSYLMGDSLIVHPDILAELRRIRTSAANRF